MNEYVEIFKDIPGYEGLYQVSNLGRVYSLPKEWENQYGAVISHKGRILTGGINGRGYRHVTLSCNGSMKTKKIHQLVAITFLNHKPCGMKLVIDHINNDKLDNRLDNLQIVTVRVNCSKDKKGYVSKYIGVSWHKRVGKWGAGIFLNGKRVHLGYFTNEKKASEYYENAVKAIEKGDEIVIKKTNFSSKYKGIHWCKTRKKWCSRIYINGKVKYLGSFKCELAAHHAYQKALNELNNG